MGTVLVTGARGMIGSCLAEKLLKNGWHVIGIDINGPEEEKENCLYLTADLGDRERFCDIVRRYSPDRIIHLAALAHARNEDDLSWERYKHINVDCAVNVFDAAGDIPVLFISTVDVFGFSDGTVVNPRTPLKPVTFYGKSKALAEEACGKVRHYDIYRFSPVYTPDIKRDIQKRYYLKYPCVAYKIGPGSEYEVLSIERAVSEMAEWCDTKPRNGIRIIKDAQRIRTADCIAQEKAAGRAGVVLRFPRWAVTAGYSVLKALTGENKYTYLLNKAVYPLRSGENSAQ